eukprot:13949616-Alexandrium_andersonii.AAC.1
MPFSAWASTSSDARDGLWPESPAAPSSRHARAKCCDADRTRGWASAQFRQPAHRARCPRPEPSG